jgi:hypothetical protein
VLLNYYQVVLHFLLLGHFSEETSIMARLRFVALVYEGDTANTFYILYRPTGDYTTTKTLAAAHT